MANLKSSVSTFRKMKQEQKPIVMLTAYDAPTAALAMECGVDLLLVGDSVGNTMLGYFSISQKLLNIPVTFIGQSLGTVFYQRSAEMARQGECVADFFYRNIRRALYIAAVPMVLLAAYGDAAITMFFGQEYAVGGTIVRIIVFRSVFTFISTATKGIDIVLEKQKYAMVSNIVQTLAVAASVYLSYYMTGNILVCTLLITVTFSCVQIIYNSVLLWGQQFPITKYLRDTAVILVLILAVSLLLRYGFIWLTNATQIGFLLWLKAFMVL